MTVDTARRALSAVFCTLAVVPSIFLVASLIGEPVGGAILIVPVVAVSAIAVGIGAMRAMNPGSAALMAGTGGFLAVLLPVIWLAATTEGSRESCEVFCMSESSARTLILVLGTAYGVAMALGAALLTAVVVAAFRRRPAEG